MFTRKIIIALRARFAVIFILTMSSRMRVMFRSKVLTVTIWDVLLGCAPFHLKQAGQISFFFKFFPLKKREESFSVSIHSLCCRRILKGNFLILLN